MHCLTTINTLQYNRLSSSVVVQSLLLYCANVTVVNSYKKFYTNETLHEIRLQDLHVHIKAIIESLETMHRCTHLRDTETQLTNERDSDCTTYHYRIIQAYHFLHS